MSNLLNDFLAHLADSEGAELEVLMTGTITADDGDFAHIATLYNTSGMTLPEINAVFRKYAEDEGIYSSCGHSHDCCGCAFLRSVQFINQYPHDDEGIFLIYNEAFGINI